MNQTEATKLVTVLNRAGLVPALDGQGAVWQLALNDVAYETAQVVATTMIATRTSDQRWVTPGDVRAAVTTQRKVNLEKMPGIQVPDALDGDPDRELEWRRTYIDAFAVSGDGDRALEVACAASGIGVPVIDPAPRPVTAVIETAAHGRQCDCSPPCLGSVRVKEGAR
ncbi:hypothetical protein GCM10025865_00980 [Paraoerskovia sediminicola]|uniref:Uncharacterized protein n=1 Tax=Paraoerskovia sediminicola TaxID=1138587 RepID=A0ABM8FYT9_9CELL|nr:hypothetical protein [Paraoerskovia sediminicola]BDZ40799.1 hypothetical protein GCM10025865_00980 [Paraoerskovia sediminicola]